MKDIPDTGSIALSVDKQLSAAHRATAAHSVGSTVVIMVSLNFYINNTAAFWIKLSLSMIE